jgi:hypothetical protein
MGKAVAHAERKPADLKFIVNDLTRLDVVFHERCNLIFSAVELA